MLPILLILLGFAVIVCGAYLVWSADQQARTIAFSPRTDLQLRWRNWRQQQTSKPGEPEPSEEEPAASTPPKAAPKIKRQADPGEKQVPKTRTLELRTSRGHGPRGERLPFRLPVNEMGRVEVDTWAGLIANGIYKQGTGDDRRRMDQGLKPGVVLQHKIHDERRLTPLTWVHVYVHEDACNRVRDHFGWNLDDLAGELIKAATKHFGTFIHPDLLPGYHPKIQVFKDRSLGLTAFDVAFFPMLPKGLLECDAVLNLEPAGGVTSFPTGRQTLFRVGDREEDLDASRCAPFMERMGEVVLLGPDPWCHLRTDSTRFGSTALLAYRKSDQVGKVGELACLELKGRDKLAIELPGYDRMRLEPRKAVVIPLLEGPSTTCTLYRDQQGQHELIGTLVIANPLPDVRILPDVNAYERKDWDQWTRTDFARFVATRLYLASKGFQEAPTFLNGDEGHAFFTARNLLDEEGEFRREARLAGEDTLCYRIKWVVSGKIRRHLRNCFGGLVLARAVAAEVVSLIEREAPYNQLFDEIARDALRDSETHPGLSLEIATDAMVHPDTLLVRTMPILASSERRPIYGRLDFTGWEDARDISGMSCHPQKTFLIQYPANHVGMRISRFPLYGVRAPQVDGVLEFALEEPGTDEAKLLVRNRCRAELSLDGNPIPPGSEFALPLSRGRDHRPVLRLGQQVLQIRIYGEPKEQKDEPEFMPAPGKLDFHGLTLARRAATTNWGNSPFAARFRAAQQREPGLSLLGVSQATGKGYLASLMRESGEDQVHFFAEGEVFVREGSTDRLISAGDSTLDQGPLSGSAIIWPEKLSADKIEYARVDLGGEVGHVLNADLLAEDYFDLWENQLRTALPEGAHFTDADLLCIDNQTRDQKENHLYLVFDREATHTRHGWLFQPRAGITRVRFADSEESVPGLDYSRTVVGPLDVDHFYRVDWRGGEDTPLSFKVAPHREQIETYLSDGFFKLERGGRYAPGGNLAGQPQIFAGFQPSYIANNEVSLKHITESLDPKAQLGFDPRALCGFFDKDSYRVAYHPGERRFAVASFLHGGGNVSTKTLFMIVPDGGQPILGSHALPPVGIPKGRCCLVFPGLTFRFSQGPVYYGFSV